MSSCAAAGWGMYPSHVQGLQCPLCSAPVAVASMTVAGRQVRLIKEHPACR